MCMAYGSTHPKGNRELRGIGIVEVFWKEVSVVANCWIGAEVDYQDMLNGYREGRGMRTTHLKVNLLQKLTEVREEVLYEVFLGLQKAYDTLDREYCIDILASYGIGPRT